jgi:hypothetical protein
MEQILALLFVIWIIKIIWSFICDVIEDIRDLIDDIRKRARK